MEPDWVPKGIATAFLIIAMIVFWTAERRACAVMGRLKTHEVETVRARNLRLISYAIMACIASLIAAMWLLRIKSEGGS
jgi:putative membrane protein